MKEIRNNNCHTDKKSLEINNSITNNPQEIANTFSDYFLPVVYTVIGNIKKSDSDSRDNVDPSNYLINNFNSRFSKLNWKYATIYEIVRLSNH